MCKDSVNNQLFVKYVIYFFMFMKGYFITMKNGGINMLKKFCNEHNSCTSSGIIKWLWNEGIKRK